MRKLTMAAVVASALALSGCLTNAQIGTGLGAVGGGLAGSQVGSGTGQLIGVGLGTVFGAAAGNWFGQKMDDVETLKRQKQSSAAPVKSNTQIASAPVSQVFAECEALGNSGARAACREGAAQRAAEEQARLEEEAYNCGYNGTCSRK